MFFFRAIDYLFLPLFLCNDNHSCESMRSVEVPTDDLGTSDAYVHLRCNRNVVKKSPISFNERRTSDFVEPALARARPRTIAVVGLEGDPIV